MPDGPQPVRPPASDLPRRARLRRRCDFARLRTEGRRQIQGCLILNWLRREGDERGRLGVVTSRKIGCAVQRSRARRLLREAWRRHQSELECPLDVVLVARASIRDKTLADVERDYLAALRRSGVVMI